MFKSVELKQLSCLSNHKIVFDGYDFWWYSNIDGKWKIHCIKSFDTYKKALSYIMYWCERYSNLYIKKNKEVDRIVSDAIDQVRIYDIVNSKLKTKNKIEQIISIKPFISQVEIANYLSLTKPAINKHFIQASKRINEKSCV